MDFERAFDTLGLAPGASEPEIESAYGRLCDDLDARLGRVTSLALRDRYAAARAELDGARAIALRAAKLERAPRGSADGAATRAWAVLGLAVGASPLEVASAYVSLCEELDRELAAAPNEALRHRCLEARAEIDSAYQHCAAAPLAAEGAGTVVALRGYETQVARATFEAPPPAANPTLVRILADPDPPPARTRRARRRPLRRFAVAAVVLFVASGALGYIGWTDPERLRVLTRYLPLPPDPELVEAQTGAEYLRRRVAEERRDIQHRAEEAAERVTRLQAEASPDVAESAETQARSDGTLEQAQARSALAKHLFELTERHIFSSSALAEAYGHMELATELAGAGETDRAVTAYTEARANLEATLARLDEAESALGARYEAVDARDAWVALASSVGLEPGNAVLEGGQRLVDADGLLEAGNFAEAIPELRQASQNFRTALDDGRHELAARRAVFEAQRKIARARAEKERVAHAAPQDGAGETDTDSLPPVSASDRADVKLVTIPAGSFLYGCDGQAGHPCPSSEAVGQRAELGAFQIDRTEVRVSEYRHCVDEGACAPPAVASGCNWNAPGRGEHPINCIDWDQAVTYCGWVGKRLPTEQEWEKAARGTDGRTYPWGNEGASCDVAVMSVPGGVGCGAASTAPVGSRDRGRSPYGLFDMAGNVYEWTGSLYASGSGARVLRGGSWKNDAETIRSSHREGALPNLRDASVGFRCAQGAIVAETHPH
jgi:formylglycine-generating enzyme required for sulfatase activity